MNLSKPPKKWYAILTKPRSEKKIYERIIAEDVEAFLPMIKTLRQWSDRKKMVETPLIPSYLFVRIEERNLFSSLPINGNIHVLRHLGKPAVIRDDEIENLRILSDNSEGQEINSCDSIYSGDDVEVINGPFIGLIATCVKEGSKHRVVVKIDSLGSCFMVDIPQSFLRKITNQVSV